MFNARTKSAALLVAVLLIPTLGHALITRCDRAIGEEAKALSHKEGKGHQLAEALVSEGGTYLYIKQLSSEDRLKVVTNVGNDIQRKKGKPPVSSANIVLWANEIPEFKDLLEHPTWYVHSNSEAFKSKNGEDSLTLVMTKAEEQRFLSRTHPEGEPALLYDGIKNYKPELVVIESDMAVPPDLFEGMARAPMVLKLNASSSRRAVQGKVDLLGSLGNADRASIAVANLLPQTVEEAKHWGFGEHVSELYSTNGRRIESDLEKYGQATLTPKGSKEDAVRAIQEASRKASFLILIGESNDGGLGLKIPGTEEVIRAADLAAIPETVTIIGLVCNSQNLVTDRSLSASIVGTLYSDQTRRFLRVVFDRREPATIEEYLGVPETASPMIETVAAVTRSLEDKRAAPPTLVLLKGKVAGLTAAADVEPLPPSSSEEDGGDSSTPKIEDQPGKSVEQQEEEEEEEKKKEDPIVLFALTGVLGGCCREVMRWKRLNQRKRSDLYLKGKFLLISFIEVLLGGAVALVFVKLAPAPAFQFPVAFVVGVGFEELVRQAAKLKIWTPEVPQDERKLLGRPWLLEYLRA